MLAMKLTFYFNSETVNKFACRKKKKKEIGQVLRKIMKFLRKTIFLTTEFILI